MGRNQHPSSSGPDPDEDIITRLALGESSALTKLMDRHLKSITALAAHMLRDPFLAEDVAQTVFLKTWQMAPNWKPGKAKLLTWMRKVATHQCLDHLRKKKPVYMDQPPDQMDPSDLPHQTLSDKQQYNMIRETVDELPVRQKLALALSYFQGVNQKEGASILDISVPAYESLLARGRANLKTKLLQNNDFSHMTGTAL